MSNHLERGPHRLGRDDRVRRDSRQALDLEDRVDLLVGQRREECLADTRRVKRHAAADLHEDAHHLVALHLGDEHRFGPVQDREVRRLA
jgi:hypothetical protein